MGYQKDDIVDLAKSMGIDTGNGSSQLDQMKKIAEAVGMDNYSGISNADTDEVQRRLRERYNQEKKDEKEKLQQKKKDDRAKLANAFANRDLGGYLKNKAKDNVKNKINDKLPDSVKQKRDAIKNKGQQIKNKINAPKDKLDNAKKNLNEKVFRKGVKSAVNTVAPGAGVAAEKLLDVG
ncbi:MAG: hypothetical protein PUD59_00155, partial [bacterium]|nr:hypothetical protein [bacterium]